MDSDSAHASIQIRVLSTSPHIGAGGPPNTGPQKESVISCDGSLHPDASEGCLSCGGGYIHPRKDTWLQQDVEELTKPRSGGGEQGCSGPRPVTCTPSSTILHPPPAFFLLVAHYHLPDITVYAYVFTDLLAHWNSKGDSG